MDSSTPLLLETLGLGDDGEERGHPSFLVDLSGLGSLMDDSIAHQHLQNADLL